MTPLVTLGDPAALHRWFAAAAAPRVVLVRDRALTGTPVDALIGRAARAHGATVRSLEVGPVDGWPEVEATARALREGDLVVGLGGGDVMDRTKLATLWHADPLLGRRIGSGQRCGMVTVPAGVRRRHRLLLVPTTVGTGAQHSRNACISVSGRKRLVSGDALRPDAAAVLADATLTLPRPLLLEGVFENLARLAGFYVGDHEFRGERDVLTERLLAETVACGYAVRAGAPEAPVPTETRAAVGGLSGRTHDEALVAGRPRWLDVSWPLANELSTVLGLRKVEALASLLGPLWSRVLRGDAVGRRIGDADRLRRLWRVVHTQAPAGLPDDPVTGLATLLADWGIDAAAAARAAGAVTHPGGPAVADHVSERAARAWGDGLPMLRGLDRTALGEVCAEALGPSTRPAAPAAAGPVGTGPHHVRTATAVPA
jgi:alcohol dehydrogenase YqhD (iron-dependent ADH family)